MIKHDKTGNVTLSPEYQQLSMVIYETEKNRTGFLNEVNDIGMADKNITVGWNFKNDILQWVVDSLQTTLTGIKNDWRKWTEQTIGHGKNSGLLRKIFLQRRGVEQGLKGALIDTGSSLFKSLFKSITINGKEAILPYLHWDITDPETIKALQLGKTNRLQGINMDDIAANNLMLDLIREQHFKNYYHSKINDMNYQIANSTKEQNIVSFEISKNIEEIAGLSQNTYHVCQKTDEKFEQVHNKLDELYKTLRQFKTI